MQGISLEKTVESFLRSCGVQSADGVIVALSGGADSMALLDVLCRLQSTTSFQLLAAHVHHGLRGREADADAAFVQAQCSARGIPLEILRADVKAEAMVGEGVEQAGRRIRYAFFDRLRERYGYAYVATAHNADDNLETVLMHLTRGSGLHGLGGIAPQSNGIIRPLLTCTRAEIEAYCAQSGVSYVNDSTNTDVTYARNRVRHQVVPQLKMLNPAVVDGCTRLTADIRAEDAFLDALADEILQNAQCDDGFLTEPFLTAPSVLSRRAVKRLLERCGSDCARHHVMAVHDIVSKDGGTVQVAGGLTVTVRNGVFKVENPTKSEPIPAFSMPLTIGKTIFAAGESYVPLCLLRSDFEKKQKVYKKVLQYACDYDKLNGSLMVRSRQNGDAFHAVGGVGKTLKKYYNEKKVLPLKRATTPLVCDADGIVLVAGFSCDHRVRLDADTKRVFLLCPTAIYEEEKTCEYT